MALATCLLQAAGLKPEQLDCLLKPSQQSPTGCIDPASSQKWQDAKKCIERHNEPFDAVTGCVATGLDVTAVKLGTCLTSNPTNGLKCAELLPGAVNSVNLVGCLRKADGGATALLNCAGTANISLDPTVTQCLQKIGTDAKQLVGSCLPGAQSGPVSCFAKFVGNNEDILTCLANEDPKSRNIVAAIRCISSGNEPSDIIASCTDGFIKDPKARQALACAAKANGNMGALTSCAAAPFLGDQEARLLTCATQSRSYAGFAICAAGPKMNQEWMIAAQCAVSSGGEPVTAAACTAGWLTLNELGKCFSQGIGGPGCFGDGNTIVVAFRNAANDITKGPGPNNEVVKALRNAGIEIKAETHTCLWYGLLRERTVRSYSKARC
jgi:hypothetical protein